MNNRDMGWFKRFSTEYAILFSLLITFLVLLFYIIAAVFAEVLGSTTAERNLIEGLGRLVGALLFVFVILRFRWQDKAGLTRMGSLSVWALTFAVLVYEVVTYLYPYGGDFKLSSANLGETASVAFNALMTGPLEEFPYRGLVLCAFIRLWADSKEGIVKSVVLSAIIFGGSHLIHILLGRPVPQATLIAVSAALGGIYYAAILLRWRTIWPAVALHSGLNAAASIVAFNTPGFFESVDTLLITIAFQIPIVILGGYFVTQIRPRRVVLKPI